jgi:hypothetical protein
MEKSLEDSEFVLSFEPEQIKAKVRKGKALFYLKRYEEAYSFIKNETENEFIQLKTEILKRRELIGKYFLFYKKN